ncbi:hypothetical protein DDB_G0282443 [Dictyostelium discoideum AX4]|uniref:Ubiquitin-like domain-containing protein n=1 Tax=Dictyostelium discoideum TaxID=44689 RepID=Q54SI7_DICDI|nr:hypothetical protein DDB_G0282443 [Dictyostelium discoideum AX4]EAL66081.1 hypothetical protein DDB_G0282443 [Dictyostelium discoideum AX4]|eukprot:XP_640052.1 hypothetical protein DDB_G0282443 [Dictyostelium discoideum AX4]
MKVHCQFPSTKEIIQFEGLDPKETTINDLKNIIYYKTGTPVSNQVIEFDTKRLSNRYDNKKLSKLHLAENSSVIIILKIYIYLRMVYSLEGGGGVASGCSCQIL